MPLRILTFSDGHFEHYNNTRWLERNYPNSDDFDVAILAGDIHSGELGIRIAESLFPNKPVFITFGNHEYYGRDYQDLRFNQIKMKDNIHLLLGGEHYDLNFDNRVYRFIGGTLWTEGVLDGYDTTEFMIERCISDFKLIKFGSRNIELHTMRQICQSEKINILEALEKSQADHNIVFTHFMPTVEACKLGRFAGDALNPYFATELEYGDKKPDLHIYGHSHDRQDFVHNNVRYVNNALGYPGENKELFEWKIIKV